MRGTTNLVKGAVFITALLGASASFAQADPRVWVYFDNVAVCPAGYTSQIGFTVDPSTGVPTQAAACVQGGTAVSDPAATLLASVSLSRNGTPPLTTRAAYDLGIWNNNTNALNRLYFRVVVTNPAGAAGDNGKIEKLVNGAGFSCYQTNDPSKAILAEPYDVADLTCTSNLSLPEKSGTTVYSRAVTVVVKTPYSGSSLKADVLAGGYEGNSETGQGCCALPGPRASTTLIDSVASGDYTYQATTFLSADQDGIVFTGNGGKPSRTDLFATNVKAPKVWTGTDATYDIAYIQEKSIPEGGGRCKQSKLKYCHQTTISLPNVAYAVPPSTADVCNSSASNFWTGQLLDIDLSIDFSSVKGNPSNLDLYSAIKISYADTSADTPTQIYQCSVTPGSFPCICSASIVGRTIQYLIRNYRNGGYFVE
jgi:hypothetical protein